MESYMRFKKLWIDGFKNLNNFELDFTDKCGITLLIGNNGSGKSNILEAISAIFANLYKSKTIDTRQWDFNYRIECEINNRTILIEYILEENHFSVTDSYGLNLSNENDLSNYLPNTCYMIYNGEDQRIKRKYYNPFLVKFRESKRSENTHNGLLPKMIYIDSFFWNISLIALLKSNNDGHKIFCQNILKNNDLSSIVLKFTFNKRYTSPIYNEFLSNLFGRSELGEEEDLSYETLNKSEQSEKNIFTTLLSMIGTNNKINKLMIESNGINTIYLSEGEKKQILLKSIISIMAKEEDLLLMDEVDSSIHVGNKIKIKDILKSSNIGETIITTHSPTLTHSFEEKHINMVLDGKIENKEKQDIVSHVSNGIWNYQEQSIFLSSRKNLILLVEGKHDKIHIAEAFKRLRSNYPELDFDIFQMNGESNIKHMMLGLANNGVDFKGKKIIAIFDNDKAGREGYNNNFKQTNDRNYKRLVDNSGKESDIFFGFVLPKKDNSNNDFTIENMYDGEKFKTAFFTALNKRTDDSFFENCVENISKQIKEDAKNQLAKDCVSFVNVHDFKYFERIFDLIMDIKNSDTVK